MASKEVDQPVKSKTSSKSLTDEVGSLLQLYRWTDVSFRYLSSVLEKDPSLKDSAKTFKAGSKAAQQNAVVLSKYMDHHRLPKVPVPNSHLHELKGFDMADASELAKEIKSKIKSLKREARETDLKDLLDYNLEAVIPLRGETRVVKKTTATDVYTTQETRKERKMSKDGRVVDYSKNVVQSIEVQHLQINKSRKRDQQHPESSAIKHTILETTNDPLIEHPCSSGNSSKNEHIGQQVSSPKASKTSDKDISIPSEPSAAKDYDDPIVECPCSSRNSEVEQIRQQVASLKKSEDDKISMPAQQVSSPKSPKKLDDNTLMPTEQVTSTKSPKKLDDDNTSMPAEQITSTKSPKKSYKDIILTPGKPAATNEDVVASPNYSEDGFVTCDSDGEVSEGGRYMIASDYETEGESCNTENTTAEGDDEDDGVRYCLPDDDKSKHDAQDDELQSSGSSESRYCLPKGASENERAGGAKASQDDEWSGGSVKNARAQYSARQLKMNQDLIWEKEPERLLVVKKLHDSEHAQQFLDFLIWLVDKYPKLQIYIQEQALEEEFTRDLPSVKLVRKRCSLVEPKDLDGMDLAVSIGGDGTLLYAASMFPNEIPPIIPFRTGTVNYLVPFEFRQEVIEEVLAVALAGKGAKLKLRTRIKCFHIRNETIINEYAALNEVAVTRGCEPHLCKILVYLNRQFMSRVDGDGLIMCTPTGSTAYSLAAGGALLEPQVPCFQLTPIAPFSICSRPVVLPQENLEVAFSLARDSRSAASVNIDGAHSFIFDQEDILMMKNSPFPLPIVHISRPGEKYGPGQCKNWFQSFHWCKKVSSPTGPSDLNADSDVLNY